MFHKVWPKAKRLLVLAPIPAQCYRILFMINAALFLALSDLISSYREITTDGSDRVVNVLKEYFTEGKVHEFQSGSHNSNWYIPEEWKLNKAELRDCATGKIILSHLDSSLFIAPYSKNMETVLTKEELKGFVTNSETFPRAFRYQHRLAYNPKLNMNSVSISIPKKLFDSLDDTHLYSLSIEVNTRPGAMKIFELVVPGENEKCVLLLSHFCHTGQWNDGLAGVLVMSMVAHHLREKQTTLKYTYRLLAFPETIGSSVYLYENENLIDECMFTLFSEMPGALAKIRVTNSRRGNSYIDRLTNYVLNSRELQYSTVNFKQGWGNDEMVFDSVFAGIPSVSIDRAPFEHYHLSTDSLANFSMHNLDQVVKVIIDICTLLERDFIPKARFFVTPQLSKLGLYKDWLLERKAYDEVNALLDATVTGKSVFDIAQSVSINFEDALVFYETLASHNLIEKQDLPASYTRK